MDENKKRQFETGAQRNDLPASFHKISPVGIRRLAQVHYHGDKEHGAFNWEKGMPVGDCINHAIGHLFEYLAGDRKEDFIAKAAWNLFAAMHMEDRAGIDHELRPAFKDQQLKGDVYKEIAQLKEDIDREREKIANNRSTTEPDKPETAIQRAMREHPFRPPAALFKSIPVPVLMLRRVADAVTPSKKYDDDAGYDLYSSEEIVIPAGETRNVDTGIDIKIPSEYWGSIKTRSSTMAKAGLIVMEGVIDPGYTGPMHLVVYNPKHFSVPVSKHQRLAQLILIKRTDVMFREVPVLPETSRGKQGFGSTGR